jgi:hypothetical protein
MKSETNRPISIEDILRLKRAERPPAEFWTDFDRELRAKQLAALVAKRPWWRRMPRTFPLFARYGLPLGACAAVAVTFFSVRSSKVASPQELPVVQIAEASAATVVSESKVQSSVAQFEVPPPSTIAMEAVKQPVHPSVSPEAIAFDINAPVPEEISRVIALGGAAAPEIDAQPKMDSPRYSEATLAVVTSATRLGRSGLLSSNGFDGKDAAAHLTIEPLQQMSLPSDARRSRLLTAMVSTASLETSVRTTERAASRIAEERLYDQVHRFGAKGDRVQVKF